MRKTHSVVKEMRLFWIPAGCGGIISIEFRVFCTGLRPRWTTHLHAEPGADKAVFSCFRSSAPGIAPAGARQRGIGLAVASEGVCAAKAIRARSSLEPPRRAAVPTQFRLSRAADDHPGRGAHRLVFGVEVLCAGWFRTLCVRSRAAGQLVGFAGCREIEVAAVGFLWRTVGFPALASVAGMPWAHHGGRGLLAPGSLVALALSCLSKHSVSSLAKYASKVPTVPAWFRTTVLIDNHFRRCQGWRAAGCVGLRLLGQLLASAIACLTGLLFACTWIRDTRKPDSREEPGLNRGSVAGFRQLAIRLYFTRHGPSPSGQPDGDPRPLAPGSPGHSFRHDPPGAVGACVGRLPSGGAAVVSELVAHRSRSIGVRLVRFRQFVAHPRPRPKWLAHAGARFLASWRTFIVKVVRKAWACNNAPGLSRRGQLVSLAKPRSLWRATDCSRCRLLRRALASEGVRSHGRSISSTRRRGNRPITAASKLCPLGSCGACSGDGWMRPLIFTAVTSSVGVGVAGGGSGTPWCTPGDSTPCQHWNAPAFAIFRPRGECAFCA